IGLGATIIDGRKVTGLLRTAAGAGRVKISGVTLEHGNAVAGGAILAQAGAELSIADALLSEDKAHTGGALQIEENASVQIASSSFSGDEALEVSETGGEGGAIAVAGGTLSIVDSTISGNHAAVSGGAIQLANAPAAAVAAFTDTTLAANRAPAGATLAAVAYPVGLHFVTLTGNEGGAAVEIKGAGLTIEGSVLDDQVKGGPCKLGTGGEAQALAANILFPAPTEKELEGGACAFTGTPPLASDPRLAALLPAGGLGATRAPERGSPAINAAGVSCPGATAEGVVRDERGRLRPQGAGCDLGAYEVAADGAVTLTPLAAGLTPGATVTLSGEVEDRGEDPIGAATVTVALPAGVTLTEAVSGCSQAGGEGNGTVTCVLGEVKGAQKVPFSLPLRLANAGTVSLTAKVAATQADFDETDDSATVTTTVSAPVVQGTPIVVGQTPPTGTPPAQKPPTSKVSLSRTLFTINSHSTVELRVSCTARTTGGCTDTIGIYSSAGRLPASAAATTAKAKLLARAKVKVAGGQTVTVRLHLSAAAQRLFKGKRSIPARLLVTVQVAAGTTSHAYNITLKKAAAVKKKKK
ncbi:MAG TPA: choice-of-anchor Q domain-containing protein, partial [Solirubrobacteraceae bacterium]|nr:choice-of-anchor Q domain-containing protein [Solirubrobacteraceae bacterium]